MNDLSVLNRSQAIAMVGERLVSAVESAKQQATNRIIGNFAEFRTVIEIAEQKLAAYFYQPCIAVESTVELSRLHWEVDHYSIQ